MITPLGNNRFLYNGVVYTSIHAAITAKTADANAAGTHTPKPETSRQRARRERRETTGR